jgi:hypothetical protein
MTMKKNEWRLEWGVALVLTLAACSLHIVFLIHAGALWRDEANTIGLATMSSLSEVWANLQFDSFPILWLLVVRTLAACGLAGDAALRATGFCVGLGLIAALWFAARSLKCGFPLFSIALLALNPSAIVWGDSMRAYGLGMCLIVVTFGLVWRFAEAPSRTLFALAALAAVCSVQTVYYNAVLLFAFCLGAVAVAVRRRAWTAGLLVLSIGALAALSLVPYRGTIRNVGQWSALVRVPRYDFSLFWLKLNQALAPAGSFIVWVWLALFVAAIGVGIVSQGWPSALGITTSQRDVALFALVTLLIGVIAYYGFLKALHYLTEPWYYVTLMTLTAVTVDALFGSTLQNTPTPRVAKLALVVAIATLGAHRAYESCSIRLTNLDLVAAKLRQIARPSDLVVVNPCYYGISFRRYNDSSIHWMTVPPTEVQPFHRYDLIKEAMMSADQELAMQPVTREIQVRLQAGARVFLVGQLSFLARGENVPPLPPAPQGPQGWYAGPYLEVWGIIVARFVQAHALHGTLVDVPSPGRVSAYENSSLLVFEGWH